MRPWLTRWVQGAGYFWLSTAFLVGEHEFLLPRLQIIVADKPARYKGDYIMKPLAKYHFFTQLRTEIQQHIISVKHLFQPLTLDHRAWRPTQRVWSIEQCFEHLNLTHDYYRPKIDQTLAHAEHLLPASDTYTPSCWARIYMYFAFNPRYSFPTAAALTPPVVVNEAVLTQYLVRQTALFDILDQATPIDLCTTPVRIKPGIRFNLGDCLKILVYHDALHIGQARGILTQLQSAGNA